MRLTRVKNTRMTIDDAIRCHEAGQLREAERLYRSILESDPRHPDALHLLGVLLTQTGNFDEAITRIRAALACDGESAPFRSSLAQAYFRSGKPAEAAEVLERVVARLPDSFQAFSDLGAALQESGELERAVDAYRRAIDLNPGQAAVFFNLGTALERQGRSADAIANVEKAVAMDPSNADFRATLAGYYLEANEPGAALQASRECLAVAPRNLTALTFQAIALARLGERAAAARLVDFERLIQCSRLPVPDGYASAAGFNEALAAHVRSHPTLRSDPINNATRFGKHTENLLVNPTGPIPAFAQQIAKAVEDYLRWLPRDATHPFLAHRPAGLSYTMWSVVMDSQGHQLPHMHPDGWVSGVYYVALPQTMHSATQARDGWIEFGRPLRELTGSFQPHVETIRPEEGMLVLFPSYFYHRTIPFESAQQRICIAFDAIPTFG